MPLLFCERVNVPLKSTHCATSPQHKLFAVLLHKYVSLLRSAAQGYREKISQIETDDITGDATLFECLEALIDLFEFELARNHAVQVQATLLVKLDKPGHV